ncbi:MAG: cupin domain-containing protein [Novosphingobium sp.]
MDLTRFDTAAFLRDTWQQRPLLIRNPWDRWEPPLDPDELAGLACEDTVEARMLVQDDGGVQAEDGPFPAARFGTPEKRPWTLLVQAVDQHVPEVAALLESFRFIPNWRIDDVMVSYASDGGGVGAHFDQYDVFLIQGQGRRRWQLGARCDEGTPLLPNDNVRLIADFQPTEDWILEPGDILYVPPRFAHNGIALSDDCMTYSIGFRAPARADLLSAWCDDRLAEMDDDDRYEDPGLTLQDNPGEISSAAIDRLHALVTERLGDRAAFARWFGGYNSTPKYPEMDWQPEIPVGLEDVRACIGEGTPLIRNQASRFSFIRQDGGAVLLFVDGECFEAADAAALFAEQLCAHDRFVVDRGLIASDAAGDLIATLCNLGSIAFEAAD